jgi:L-ascorbate metabolism protein UlaG (beta-lactamase superfamily)
MSFALKTTVLICLCCLLGSCRTILSSNPRKLNKKGIIKQHPYSVEINKNPGRELQIQYLGCGGMLIRQGNSAFLTDPFFSNTGVIKVGLSTAGIGKIKPKKEMIQFGTQRIQGGLRDVTAVLVGHSHYDHLLDVPYLYNRYLDTTKAKIYGSRSVCTAISKVVNPAKLVDIEPGLADLHQPGEWITIAPDIRVLPVRSDHAPHIGKRIKFYKGSCKAPIEGYETDDGKSKAKDWKEGQTVAYLVDLMAEKGIALRLFIQTSSCNPTAGFPPIQEIARRKVDVAMLCLASYGNISLYAEAILNYTAPKQTVFIHWEDFFRSYDKSPRLVRATKVNAFFPRIEKVYARTGTGSEERYAMPTPGNVITIRY